MYVYTCIRRGWWPSKQPSLESTLKGLCSCRRAAEPKKALCAKSTTGSQQSSTCLVLYRVQLQGLGFGDGKAHAESRYFHLRPTYAIVARNHCAGAGDRKAAAAQRPRRTCTPTPLINIPSIYTVPVYCWGYSLSGKKVLQMIVRGKSEVRGVGNASNPSFKALNPKA